MFLIISPFMAFKSGKQESSSSTQTSYTPEQRKGLEQAISTYLPTLGQGQTGYGGQRLAGLTPTQEGIFGQLPNFATAFGDLGQPSNLQPQLESTAGQLLGGELGAQPITPEQEASYFGRAIQEPRMKQFREEEAPLIREEFAGPGYWGSARANELAEAGGDVGDWLGTQRAQLGWDVLGRNQELKEAQANRALGAMGPSLAVGQAPLAQAQGALGGLSQTLAMASPEQQQQQAQINEAIGKWAEQQQITDPQNLQILMTLLGLNYTTEQRESQVGGFSPGGMDWARMGAGALGGLF